MNERYFIYTCDRILFKSEDEYEITQEDIEEVFSFFGFSVDDELSHISTEEYIESCVHKGYLQVYDRGFRGFLIPEGTQFKLSTYMVQRINELTNDESFVSDEESLEIHKYLINDWNDSIDYYFRAFKILEDVVIVFDKDGKWRVVE